VEYWNIGMVEYWNGGLVAWKKVYFLFTDLTLLRQKHYGGLASAGTMRLLQKLYLFL